jgi:hypothetical protein
MGIPYCPVQSNSLQHDSESPVLIFVKVSEMLVKENLQIMNTTLLRWDCCIGYHLSSWAEKPTKFQATGSVSVLRWDRGVG